MKSSVRKLVRKVCAAYGLKEGALVALYEAKNHRDRGVMVAKMERHVRNAPTAPVSAVMLAADLRTVEIARRRAARSVGDAATVGGDAPARP